MPSHLYILMAGCSELNHYGRLSSPLGPCAVSKVAYCNVLYFGPNSKFQFGIRTHPTFLFYFLCFVILGFDVYMEQNLLQHKESKRKNNCQSSKARAGFKIPKACKGYLGLKRSLATSEGQSVISAFSIGKIIYNFVDYIPPDLPVVNFPCASLTQAIIS